MRYDFRTTRLFVENPLSAGASVPLDRGQINYLCNVLRIGDGAPVLVFNSRDGEWRAELKRPDRRSAALLVCEQTRPQDAPADLHYLFAPLKQARFDYMVQKAVELGVSHLQPVITRHGQVGRVNLDRVRANAIEAAEQCGILNIPTLESPLALPKAIDALGKDRVVIFCDEDSETQDPLAALTKFKAERPPLAVLVGPEGGFADDERAMLLRRTNVVRLALGPRILRADTAAVAALTLVQAVLGDWR